jgi:alkylation response protein AidB-like acyl-CoA dehydrogenase
MNYEFSDKEFNFFVEISELITGVAKETEADTGNDITRQALSLLSQTPYLKLGIKQVDDLNGMLTLMGAMEIVAGASPSLYLSIETSTRIFGRILSAWGDDAQKEKILAPLLKGEIIGAVGLSEASMNIDNDPLSTTGEIKGDSVEVNGRKQYVINAPIADQIAVVGMMDGKNAIFLVAKDTPGLTIGERTSTLGYEGVAISEIELNNCTIDASQVICPKNDKQMLDTLRLWENQVLIGASLGLMKSSFESAKNYSKQHKTGGKPIIAYQEVGFKLSEMLTLFQTSQLFAYRTVWTADADPKEADSLTLCAKVFCTESAEKVASDAMKILGGAGYITGNDVERAFRCAKYGQFAGTSTEISRVKIGDTALGIRK